MRDNGNSATKRALIYARVSSDEQSRGYSLDTQLASIRSYCAQEGYQIIGEFSDVFTGTEIDRPGMNALITKAEEVRPDAVVLYDVDRLGRELIVQAVLDQEIERTGAEVEFVLGGKDELMRLIKGALAVYENRQRTERSQRGKRGRVQSGQVMISGGRAPYGYDYISEPHRGRLVINEEEAEIVRLMYHWLIIERLSSYAIAKRLWERGVPTRGDTLRTVYKERGYAAWNGITVRSILSSPVCKGEWIYGKTRKVTRNGKKRQVKTDPSEWITVSVPAIVDAETWERAQECLTENKLRSPRNAKHQYLLRGMVYCDCGIRRIGIVKSASKTGYYHCNNGGGERWRSTCQSRFYIRQDRIEPAVWDYVTEFLLDRETMVAEIERQRQAQKAELATYEQRRKSAEATLADIDRKLSRLLDDMLDGIPEHVVQDRKRTLLAERAEAEEILNRRIADAAAVTITPDLEELLNELSETVRTALPEMTFEERRKLLDLLRIRVDVLDRQTVKVSGVISGAVLNISSA